MKKIYISILVLVCLLGACKKQPQGIQREATNIIYDPYRNLYLRLAEHPLQDWNEKGAFCKPFSIVISDTKGEILSESSISTDYKQFHYQNMHVCKEGIAIAMENPDENHIYFACIKINK